MQNFGNTSFNLKELKKILPLGDLEQGAYFNAMLLDMVMPDGITNPYAEELQLVSSKWKELAKKPNKTPEDKKILDDEFYGEIENYAQSFFLFILKEIKSNVPRLNYNQFREFMLKHRFFGPEVRSVFTEEEIEQKIKNAFLLIASAGFINKNDNIIDLEDLKIYIFALTMNVKLDVNKQFDGFEIKGTIFPRHFALNEAFLFDEVKNNMFLFKLEMANRTLNDNWREE